jgi:hypothetical protein
MVKTKLHRMTWYTVSCGKTVMGLLLYKLFSMVNGLFIFMFGFGSNDCFMTDAPCLNGIMVTNIICSMSHSRSNSVGLLMMDGSVHIRGTSIILQVLQDSRNSAKKGLISWVDHMKLTYDMTLLL